MKRLLIFPSVALLLLLATLLSVGSKSARAKSAGSATGAVKIDNFSFAPTIVTVPVGTTVTWTNRDDIPHTVVSDDKVFKSKVLDTDEKFSYTFTKPGAYPYFCSVHPKMTARIVVQE
ncbi:MAG TPA: cupredoxin domain-containing protein [Terriglobales bacterium]|nr:cupredoxin domain-containing protein [Terriglobales bacterium]